MSAPSARPVHPLDAPILRPYLRPWRELAAFSVLIMGLSWGVPWFRSLTQATYELSSGYTFAVMGGMAGGAYLLVRYLNHLQLNLRIRRVVLGGMLIASMLGGLKLLLYEAENVSLSDLATRPLQSFSDATALLPDEFIILLTVLLAWNWGVRLAQDNIEPARVMRSFQAGLAMLFFYIFVNTFVTGESFGQFANLFVFAGLMGMGAARIDSLSALRGGRENPFDLRWLAGVLLAGLGVVGVAGWVAVQVSGEETFLGLLPRLLVGVAIALAFLVALPLFLVAYYALVLALRAVSSESEMAQNLDNLLNGLRNLSAGFLAFMETYLGPLTAFFSRYAPWIKSGILWAVVAGLAAGIVLVLTVRDRRRRFGLADQRQSLLGELNLFDLLRQGWKPRLDAAAARLARLADLRHRRRLLDAARIRHIYADLMDLAAQLNHPRPEAATPLEFLPELGALFPARAADLATITHAYLKVRYGELPETREEVRAVEAAWKQVREEGERVRRRKGEEGTG